MHSEILFLTLKVFSSTGGIERVCRIMGKSLFENATRFNKRLKIFSLHDQQKDAVDNPYFPLEIFHGFQAKKFQFVRKAVWQGRQSRVILMSHVNLLVAGWLIKKINPRARLVLIVHGVEVWRPLGNMKKRMLRSCDEIVSVSEFTRQKMMELHQVPADKIQILHNCLDPFLPLLKNVPSPEFLRKRYGLAPNDRVLFTLTRLASTERYKGYNKVMEALVQIQDPHVKYLIAGKYDAIEKEFLDELIERLGLQDRVILAGFIPEEEVASHFRLSDVYVMPSMKEGFGIVFIEAMYYQLPVIAGNKDGSVDALLNGELGILVDPLDVDGIRDALESVLVAPKAYLPNQELLAHHFSYETYKYNVNRLLARHGGWNMQG